LLHAFTTETFVNSFKLKTDKLKQNMQLFTTVTNSVSDRSKICLELLKTRDFHKIIIRYYEVIHNKYF